VAQHWICLALLVCRTFLLSAAEPGTRVSYAGGTASLLKEKTDGILRLSGEEALLFRTRKVTIRVPYDKINLLEYGQNASRRYALAILISPMLLLSKSRRHFVTVGYTDQHGQQQALVFQLPKDAVRTVLAGLEAKTGRRVEYQDNEARRSGEG